jgi:hypothetical protein
MADYLVAVANHDPHGFAADSADQAVRYAVAFVEGQHADDLQRNPQDVVTLMGPSGLITRPGERIIEFVQRVPGRHVGVDPTSLQPGDVTIPDCNGD